MHAAPLAADTDLARNLTEQLGLFLGRMPSRVDRERRTQQRVAIPLLLTITCDPNNQPGESAVVTTGVGKDLSRSGIAFFHRDAVPHRRVMLTFEDPRLDHLSVEVELNRCRFSKLGWYESGARLVRLIEREGGRRLAG